MTVERIACPACGGALDVADDAALVKCRFCGSMLHLNFGPAPSTGIDADGTIRDQATGKGLFTGKWPQGWRVHFTSLDMASDTSRPYCPRAGLSDGKGSLMVFLQGPAGVKWSTAMKGMMAVYGGQLQGTDRTNYADMPDPVQIADGTASSVAAGADAGYRYLTQLALPGLAQRQQEALARGKRSSDLPASDPFVAEVLRVYEFAQKGAPRKAAVYVRLGAVKLNVATPMLSAAGGLVGLIGALGQSGAQNRAATPQQGAFADNWRTHDQARYSREGTISWDVDLVATLNCAAREFDSLLPAFVESVHAAREHADITNLTMQVRRQQDAAIQQSTQSALARQQAAFQAQQAAVRDLQSAMDARNASWQAAQDAHHAGVIGGGPSGRAPDYSEAIRGVNTYTTSEGREVQISVQADHAWENQGGDVIGTQGSFEPGSDWTELPRI